MNRYKKAALLLVGTLGLTPFATTANQDAETLLKVGLIKDGRVPYFWQDQTTHEPKGFYVELLDEIAQQTSLSFTYRFTPQARIRLNMKIGALDLEPGIAKSWRQASDEIGQFVYSIPFVLSEEIIVSHSDPGFAPNSLQELKPGKRCRVLGFNGLDSKHEIVDVLNDLQMLNMLHRGRCDYGVIPLDIAKYLAEKHNLTLHYSQPLVQFKLRLRLDKQYENLLPEINAAIAHMKESGQMKALLNKYQMKATS